MNPLIRLIPPFLVRFFAKPYVAGDSLEKALDVAAGLWSDRGLSTTLDLLAEDIEDEAMAQRNLETYLGMVDAVAADGRFDNGFGQPTLSLKPSSYTASPLHDEGDGRGSKGAIHAIVERARDRKVGITIDMESRFWTDFTLGLFRELYDQGHDHVSCVLQSRLNRTVNDLEKLPEGCRVRLVIGIYREPDEVAISDKREMKERMLSHGARLLERGHYVEFATHDEAYVRSFVDRIAPATGAGPDRYEIQMLYGVPRIKLLKELRSRGIRARLYVPFALGWDMAIQYLRRRLDEYPAMMFLVARNMILRG